MKVSVDEAWDSFNHDVLPVLTTDAERQMLRIAFYAGSAFVLHAVQHMSQQSDPEAWKDFQRMLGETKQFLNSVTVS